MKSKGLHALLRELSDDDEDVVVPVDKGVNASVPLADDPQQPWFHNYCAYLDVPEQVPEGWTAIQWWGVSILIRVLL